MKTGGTSTGQEISLVGIVRRRLAAESVRLSLSPFLSSPSAVPTNQLEMEVEAGRDHVAVVVETFISDVLVSRFNVF